MAPVETSARHHLFQLQFDSAVSHGTWCRGSFEDSKQRANTVDLAINCKYESLA